MKSFQFESISLLSHRDKKARKVIFHRHRTLLLGENHTGKSSLVKNLFITLGATPQGVLEFWDPQTISKVDFKVDGKIFCVIHQNDSRALFDESGELLSATSDYASWVNIFADLIDFNLVITARKDGKAKQADPACFFLPFYIDQDGSWRDKWDTFPMIKKFFNPIQSVLEYFIGIKSSEYYELKSECNELSRKVDAQANEMKILERTRIRLRKALPGGLVNLSEAGFENEVKQLTIEANRLNIRQENLRLNYFRESEAISSIRKQIEVAYASLRAYESDKKYLVSLNGAGNLICPTCGAEHEKSFLSFLSYAEDARILEELTFRLREDLDVAKQRQALINNKLKDLRENYLRINEILEKKRGEIEFREVVESCGAQVVHKAFDIEQEEISVTLANLEAKLLVAKSRLNELIDKERTKKIIENFHVAYSVACKALHVPDPTGRVNLLSRPNRSGSGGPRLLLAYYAALWKTCFIDGLNELPVVIDSPNQRDQDDMNLHLVLDFIAESLPVSRQLIVCLTKQTEASFDKIYTFDEKYSLLQRENYEEVESEIDKFYQKMNMALLFSSRQMDILF